MKRLLALMLCFAMLLAGCSRNTAGSTGETQAAETTGEPIETTAVAEPTETEPPVPDTIPAAALADHTVVVLATVDRDAVVEVVGAFDEDHYVVKMEDGYGLVEKRLVRMADAEAYEQWDGYARYRAKLYNNYHLRSEGAQDLRMNTKLRVLDSLGDCCLVQTEETVGYMLESEISRNYIQSSSGGSSSGGGSGGGADGGDISFSYRGGITFLSAFAPQSGEVSGTATVLAGETEILLGWYDRGETMYLVNEPGFAEEKEGYDTVYLDGLYGYVRSSLIAREGAEAYAQWDGYAYYHAGVYDNYYLAGEPTSQLSTNTVVHVLCDLGECYLVSVGEETGYMNKEEISQNRVVYGGGGSSGGSGGSGGGEWSDPVL